jgi:hypothetical protein
MLFEAPRRQEPKQPSDETSLGHCMAMMAYTLQFSTERQSVVARESPYLAAGCCDFADHGRHEAESDWHEHDNRASFTASGIVEYGNEGRLVPIREDFGQISP